MKTIPILFSGPMVRALLAGRKTQTRRIPTAIWNKVEVGDLLYVREAFTHAKRYDDLSPAHVPCAARTHYLDDIMDDGLLLEGRYRHARFMPKARSRLTLRVTKVNRQKIWKMREEDVLAEGVDIDVGRTGSMMPFLYLWDSLHGKKPGEAWVDNPEVIAISFEVIQQNVDEVAA